MSSVAFAADPAAPARPARLRALLLEDNPLDAELVVSELKRCGFDPECDHVGTRHDFVERIESDYDVILADYQLPAFDGLQALELVRARGDTPFILISGTMEDHAAVQAIRSGADDYLLKDRLARLGPAIQSALERRRLRADEARAQEARKAAEEKYRVLVETSMDAVIMVDERGIIEYANSALSDMFGYAADEVVGRELAMLQPERLRDSDGQGFRGDLDFTVPHASRRPVETLGLHRDGHEFPVEIAFSDMLVTGRQRFAFFLRDATVRKAQEDRIVRLSRIHAVLSNLNAAIVHIRDEQELLDAACRIALEHGHFGIVWIGRVDAASQEVTPVATAGLESSGMAKLRIGVGTPQWGGAVARAIRQKAPVYVNDITVEVQNGGERRREAIRRGYRSVIALPLAVDGEIAAVFSMFARERDFFDEGEVRLLTELAANISFALESMARQERLDYMSYYDPLTGLPNCQLFLDRAGQQMRLRSGESRMVSLTLFEIERFRGINETLGRAGGDALLRQVASRLESAFGGKDFLARVGPDSFGIVMHGVRDAAEAANTFERQIAASLSRPFVINGEELRIAVRAGIAVFPADGPDADTLFRNAEAAIKRAKATGERYVFYAPEMNAQAAQSILLETRLRAAVDARQFVLHYQPKVDLASGGVCGLEALIRWQDPASGLLVPPCDFIPMLEETGLILEVGQWAIAQALRDCAEWTSRGCTVPRIAVNVSAIQLQQKDFADKVIGTVHDAGHTPDALELEVTESLVMKDLDTSMRKLSALHGIGIHIAIDDFGTGHSSLSYIARLPIDALKIDRSFVSAMADSPHARTIVTTVVTLARALDLRVIAEGIETAEQLQLLAALGCHEGQGYYFSRPLPSAEIEGVLRNDEGTKLRTSAR